MWSMISSKQNPPLIPKVHDTYCYAQLQWDYKVEIPHLLRLDTRYGCNIGWSDAGYSGSGDKENGVTLDIPYFSSPLFSSLLFSSHFLFATLDLGPVQMVLA